MWHQEEGLIWKESDKMGFGHVASGVCRGHPAEDDQQAGIYSRNLIKGRDQQYLFGRQQQVSVVKTRTVGVTVLE